MTRAGVREALAVLPTWRWAALYVAAYVAGLLLETVARVSGAVAGAVAGYVLAGPLGGLVGLLVGAATQDGPLWSLVSALLRDGAARMARAVNVAAATVADLSVPEDVVFRAGRAGAPEAVRFAPAGVR